MILCVYSFHLFFLLLRSLAFSASQERVYKSARGYIECRRLVAATRCSCCAGGRRVACQLLLRLPACGILVFVLCVYVCVRVLLLDLLSIYCRYLLPPLPLLHPCFFPLSSFFPHFIPADSALQVFLKTAQLHCVCVYIINCLFRAKVNAKDFIFFKYNFMVLNFKVLRF